MSYTGEKLRLLEFLGARATDGDTHAAKEFVTEAFAELERIAGQNEKLASKAVSLLCHVPQSVTVGDLHDTATAFKFWRASQSTEYWQCPCGCKSFYPIERTVCPDSGHVRAQDLAKVKWQ